MYLLDTNACIEFLRFAGQSGVAGRLADCRPGEVAICSVVKGELVYGAW